MTEFEKWFSADGSIIPVAGDAGYEGYIERRTAWRAALKCVKEFADSETCSRIDEELQNGST